MSRNPEQLGPEMMGKEKLLDLVSGEIEIDLSELDSNVQFRREGRRIVVNKKYFEGRGYSEEEMRSIGELEVERLKMLTSELRKKDGVENVKQWRKLEKQGRSARRLKNVVEMTALAKRIIKKNPGKAKSLGQVLSRKFNLSDDLKQDQFLKNFIGRALGIAEGRVDKQVQNILKGLEKVATKEGEIDLVDYLSSNVNLGIKKSWLEAQVLPRVNFLARQDIKEAKKIPEKEEELEELQKMPADSLPPVEQDSMESLKEQAEKGKEEASAYFRITPFYGGYYKETTYDSWDARTNRWVKRKPAKFSLASSVETFDETVRVVNGAIRGGARTSISVPYNFAFKPETLNILQGLNVKILEDEQGNYVFDASDVRQAVVPLSIEMARRKVEKNQIAGEMAEINVGNFSSQTESFLQELRNQGLSQVDMAKRLKSYVKNLLEYSTNFAYNTLQEVEQNKKADCDTANTFYLALLTKLGISARMASGHYIKVKDHSGAAVISGSTGHAWSEVWDEKVLKWIRLDATPKGDPDMDDEEMDEKEEDQNFEGDFGEEEAEILSDEELVEMIKEVEEEIRQELEKQKSLEEQRELFFTEQAGCSREEAREILQQIESAKNLKDKKGRNILDKLSKVFLGIIQENLKEMPAYIAPVKMPRGDELDDVVETWIDLELGEAEPGGFKKFTKKFERNLEYGGFDLILVADKSGSMAEVDPKTGQQKYKEQQKFIYLCFEALHKFSEMCRKNRIKLLSPIDVRVSLVDFSGNTANVVLPLSSLWSPKEQLIIWKSLQENVGGGTPDHLGLETARNLIAQDIEKANGEKNKKALKDRLRLVITSCDGGSDNSGLVARQRAELKKMGVVAKHLGLTESAKAIKATYQPDGDFVDSVADAPEWVANELIEEVRKLRPKRVKR